MQQQGQMKSIAGDTRPLPNNKRPYRKTSAEIVSEAKSILAGGGTGARLVVTRRPITPREPRPGRHLYGRVAPEGRPPSAFSLRYLQFESRALPSLEPIPQITQSFDDVPSSPTQSAAVQRSESTGSLHGSLESAEDSNNNSQKRGKLPALLQPPKITASLDNLLEEMPPRKDHPLRKMQTKSCEGSLRGDKPVKNSPAGTPQQSHVAVRGIKLNRANDLLTQSSTETLLEMLKAHTGVKECTDESVQHITGILTELYSRVKGARGGWRGAVLTALYGLVECASPKVLLAVARVVLALRVTGSNLTGACKLIFKVARNESNDNLFIDCDVAELLIEGLGRASPLEEPEACIYGYGAVRFLASANQHHNSGKGAKRECTMRYKSLAYRLARHGAIDLMVLHLQMLNEAGARAKLAGPPLHALYQLSGALRALAGAPIVIQAINNPTAKGLTTTQTTQFGQIKETLEGEEIQLELAGPHLVRAAEICIDETETQANVIRTLSVLSELDVCCGVMVDSAAKLAILLGPWPEGSAQEMPKKSLGIVSRLGYILGNIVASWDAARTLIYENDVSMEHLITALEYYSGQDLQARGQGEDSVVDVIVKLVRVVANMCVNSDVGTGMCRRPFLGSTLLSLIRTTNRIPVDQMTDELEEMLLAILGALHNLSFYQEEAEEPLSSVNGKIQQLSSALVDTLKSQSIASQAEAARVLGNMTRNFEAREAICSVGGLKVLVRNLESEDFELVSSSCGVLVNLLGDWERRAPFKELKGPLLLRDVLQRSAMEEDWLLAGIVCQALWNFLIDTENVVAALGGEEAECIMQDLVECLGDEEKKKIQRADELWEQFSFVAGDLLDRIQAAPISITNSPCISSESDDNDAVGEKVGQAWGTGFRQWLDE
ncbi:armadillo repeat-containing protein 2 [Phlebotomus argentipes]|uniref:armadillo repeat-containing protein 2 n=1 Tax=Phlebotomus argentipes TaxID=94469 RepID=UPI002892B50D|nr:armadillo repeat-containing protein 2 [Phlebotomus argentipes]